ncbi:DUF3786 domain-containing protein [Dehalobacter sp. DCM]|uniref:DUF3786 domain-containing protein n=1 Tax=Dehalobacter sp. DCM TaxID=2907827 RepID=UPI003081A9B0|nr:DUF3786 domain-containing protein [Dehalobacter sp. DCM]
MANSEAPYEFMRAKLKDCDPVHISRKAGVDYDQEKQEFRVFLMGKLFIVSFPAGDIMDSNYTEFNNYPVKALILRYLINAQGTPPTGRDITYRDISGGQVYYRNFTGRCIMRLARMYGRDFPSFEKVMTSLNVDAKRTEHGDISFRFRFVNNIYVTFILWRGDDEFPATANILFDANVGDYFDAEDLAVVGDVSLNFMKAFAK